jgi:hypothetical protein
MEENQSLLELQVDKDASNNLLEVSRWAKFLGILVIIGVSLIFVMILLIWSRLAPLFMTGGEINSGEETLGLVVVVIVFAIFGVIVGILMSFLIKGANRIRTGIQNRDQLLFNSGLASIKNFFTMYGVLALIGLFFSLIALLTN